MDRYMPPATSSRGSDGPAVAPDLCGPPAPGPWAAYEACEQLADVEERLRLWRFRHVETVERALGSQRGTGGSSSVGFLRAALELTSFPELYAVRTEIGST